MNENPDRPIANLANLKNQQHSSTGPVGHIEQKGRSTANLANLRRFVLPPTEPHIALVDSYVRVRIGLYENAFFTGLTYSEPQEELDLD